MRVPLPTSRSGRRLRLSLLDLVWALASPIFALYLRDAGIAANVGWGTVASFWALAALLSLLAFIVFRIHDGVAHYFSVHDMLDVVKAAAFTEVAICVVLFTISRLDGIPRSVLFIHGLLLVTGLVACRMFSRIRYGEASALEYHFSDQRIILIGANRFSSFFIKLLNAYAPHQQRIIAVLDENASMIGRAISGVRILGVPQELETVIDEFAIHGVCAERVVVAGETDSVSPEALEAVKRACEHRQIELSFLPRMIGVSAWRHALAPQPVAQQPDNEAAAVRLPLYFWLKRGLDVVGSMTLIVLLCPLFAVAGCLVLLDVGAPVFFWQQRIGRHGRPFLIYKFRTLRAPFDAAGNATAEHMRLSSIGRVLRVTRIDELPQLLNVLIGDMSLIGPRPLLPEDQPQNSAVRLLVRPGITGWAQVNGAKLVSIDAKEKLDEWYVNNLSLVVDIKIILMTIHLLLNRTYASEEAKVDREQVRGKNVVALRSARKVEYEVRHVTQTHGSSHKVEHRSSSRI